MLLFAWVLDEVICYPVFLAISSNDLLMIWNVHFSSRCVYCLGSLVLLIPMDNMRDIQREVQLMRGRECKKAACACAGHAFGGDDASKAGTDR